MSNLPAVSIKVHRPHSDSQGIVIWVHGGGWITGGGANSQLMRSYFNKNGFCYASLNYPINSAAGEVLIDKQIYYLNSINSWLHGVNDEDKCAPSSRNVTIIGHSAGAHLVSLADKMFGWGDSVRNIVLLDCSAYKLTDKANELRPALRALFFRVFGLSGEALDGSWISTLNQYSPAEITSSIPPGRAIHLYSSEKDNSIRASKLLMASYMPSANSIIQHTVWPFRHDDFHRLIGAHTDYSSSILDICADRD